MRFFLGFAPSISYWFILSYQDSKRRADSSSRVLCSRSKYCEKGGTMDAEMLLNIAVVIVTLPLALLGGFALVIAYSALEKDDSWVNLWHADGMKGVEISGSI